MSAAVWVDGARIELGSVEPLAVGGEAAVHAVSGSAIKLWHRPTEARARKLEALLARRSALPRAVVAPEHVVLDAPRGRPVGFTMPLLPSTYEPFAALGNASHRAALGVSTRVVLGALGELQTALAELHAQGIVVGDLSDQNVVVDTSSPQPIRLIDVDSFQLPGFPCEVSTEAFLDPALYGPDLARPHLTVDGAPRAFSPESDAYAFAVLAFRALAHAHPYGGAFDGLPTLPRRASARVSVLRPVVRTPPRIREAIELVDGELRAHFEAVFEGGARPTLEPSALTRYAATLVSCGRGHEIPAARLPCPRCAPPSAAAYVTSGRLRALVVFEAGGPVVAMRARGDDVVLVAIERGIPVLHVLSGRPSRHALAAAPSRTGWDVALGAGVVAIAARGAAPVASVDVMTWGPSGLARVCTSTERVHGVASIAASDDAVFRVARGTVLCGRIDGGDLRERAVATVVSGRARIVGVSVGGAAGAVALGSALGRPRWALITDRRSVDLPAPAFADGEVIREVDAHGDGDAVVVLARTSLGGCGLVRVVGYDDRGRVLGERTVPEATRAAEGVISGGAARGAAVLHATARGLVREGVRGDEAVFPESAAFTPASAPVALARGGALVADGALERRLVGC